MAAVVNQNSLHFPLLSENKKKKLCISTKEVLERIRALVFVLVLMQKLLIALFFFYLTLLAVLSLKNEILYYYLLYLCWNFVRPSCLPLFSSSSKLLIFLLLFFD